MSTYSHASKRLDKTPRSSSDLSTEALAKGEAIAHRTGLRLHWRAKLEPYPAPIRTIGFTLIELSIVLVIIGLLVGGVLVGNDLIEAAKLREYISQKEEYNTAVNTFRLKYNALPGDMANARDFLGSDCGASASECNGDGNKSVDLEESGTSANADWYMVTVYKERCMFWRHLFLAGLVETGNFSCDDSLYSKDNSPNSPFNKNTYSMVTVSCKAGVSNANCDEKNEFILGRHYLYTGGSTTPSQFFYFNVNVGAGAFNPSQLHNIDSKLDDGLPTTGNIVIPTDYADIATSTNPCINGSNEYDLTETDYRCHLRWKMGF